MLTTITIFIIALHMSVTFPTGLTTETKLWSLGGFAFLALFSLLSAFIQAVKGRDMTLLQKMLLMKAIGFMITFSYDFLEEDKTYDRMNARNTDGNKQHVFPACNGNARRSVNCVNTELSEGQFRFGDIAQKGIPIFV